MIHNAAPEPCKAGNRQTAVQTFDKALLAPEIKVPQSPGNSLASTS